ncbi:MAG: S1 RNA-binding domain-containing protein, partial [Polyangiales bacterium]
VYRTIYMQDHIGEELDGRISGFAPFGIFVQLEEPFVSVLLPFEQLDDTFEPDELGIRLLGVRTSKIFTMNDPVTVRIEEANVQSRNVIGSLLGHEQAAAPTEARRRQGRRTEKRDHTDKQRRGGPAKKRGASKRKRSGAKEGQQEPRKRPRRARRK